MQVLRTLALKSVEILYGTSNFNYTETNFFDLKNVGD